MQQRRLYFCVVILILILIIEVFLSFILLSHMEEPSEYIMNMEIADKPLKDAFTFDGQKYVIIYSEERAWTE